VHAAAAARQAQALLLPLLHPRAPALAGATAEVGAAAALLMHWLDGERVELAAPTAAAAASAAGSTNAMAASASLFQSLLARSAASRTPADPQAGSQLPAAWAAEPQVGRKRGAAAGDDDDDSDDGSGSDSSAAPVPAAKAVRTAPSAGPATPAAMVAQHYSMVASSESESEDSGSGGDAGLLVDDDPDE
jgi:hypothetical protein